MKTLAILFKIEQKVISLAGKEFTFRANIVARFESEDNERQGKKILILFVTALQPLFW
jgi:hypothetical protein